MVRWVRDALRFLTIFFVGYDLFISYVRRRNTPYAKDLHERLERRGLVVFWDDRGFEASQVYEQAVKRSLKRSKVLLLLADEAIFGSKFVMEEVATFAGFGRRRTILPIELDGTLERARGDDATMAGLARDARASGILATLQRPISIREPRQGHGRPSIYVVKRVTRAYRNTRRTRLMMVATGLSLVFVALIAGGLYWYWNESMRRGRETEAQRLANLAMRPELTPVQRLLLAVEAVRSSTRAGEDPVPQAEQTLHQALRSIGGVPLGHAESLGLRVEFSADGRRLAALVDGPRPSLTIRDLDRPEAPPRSLRGCGRGIIDVAFGGQGRFVSAAVGPAFTGQRPKMESILFWDLDQPDPAPTPLRGAEGRMVASAFSTARGRLAAVAEGHEGSILVHDLDHPERGPRTIDAHSAKVMTGETVVGNGYRVAISGLGLGAGGRRLVGCFDDGVVRLWDLDRPEAPPATLPGLRSQPTGMRFSGDGSRLAVACADGVVRVWKLDRPGQAPDELAGHAGQIYAMAFSSDGYRLATAAEGAPEDDMEQRRAAEYGGALQTRIWYLARPSEKPVPLENYGEASRLVFSPDGDRLLIVSRQPGFWQLDRVPPVYDNLVRDGSFIPSRLAFSPDERRVAVGHAKGGAVWVWGMDHLGYPTLVLAGNEGSASPLRFSPDGRRLVTADSAGNLRIFELDRPSADPIDRSLTVRAGSDALSFSILSPDGRHLAGLSGRDFGNSVDLWDFEQPERGPVRYGPHGVKPRAWAFSPDGRFLAIGGEDRAARIWKVGSPEREVAVLRGHEGPVHSLAFSPDGLLLATGSEDGTARVWDLNRGGSEVAVLRGLTVPRPFFDEGFRLAISPDHGRLAVADGSHKIRLWDFQRKGASPELLEIEGDEVENLAFSPDGRRLISVGYRQPTRVWNLDRLPPVAMTLPSEGGEVASFSPDSRVMLLGGGSNSYALWSYRHLERSPVLIEAREEGSTFSPSHALFSRDGRRLLAADGGRVRAWLVRTGDLIGEGRRTAGRNFTLAEWREFFPDQSYRPVFPDLPCPKPDDTFGSIARNLTRSEWRYYFPGQPYVETFPDPPLAD